MISLYNTIKAISPLPPPQSLSSQDPCSEVWPTPALQLLYQSCPIASSTPPRREPNPAIEGEPLVREISSFLKKNPSRSHWCATKKKEKEKRPPRKTRGQAGFSFSSSFSSSFLFPNSFFFFRPINCPRLSFFCLLHCRSIFSPQVIERRCPFYFSETLRKKRA